MFFPVARNIALAVALCASVGAAHAEYTAPPLPAPIYHDLDTNKIFANQGLSFDIVTGAANSTSKTNQYDVFKFSMDYPRVLNFKVIIDTAHDYGANVDGVVEYAWGLVGEDDPTKPKLFGLFKDIGNCDGILANGATCASDGNSGALIKNYPLALPAVEGAKPGETYWVGIRNYADYSTYSVSMVAAAAPVPEPETYAMLLAGLGLMGAIARRRRQKQ